MDGEGKRAGQRPGRPEWFQALARFEQPDLRHTLTQLANTVGPILALDALMVGSVLRGYPYWITLAMAVVTAGLLMRVFIFLHDCSHGSFFASPRANEILGFLCGVMLLIPYVEWRWTHLTHHATFANLDRRAEGDIRLMTVEEYRTAPWRQRLEYRIYRDPFFLFTFGPTFLFALIYRFPIKGAPPRERTNVWLTDLAILAVLATAYLTVGLRVFFLVMTPVWLIVWTTGVWFFYVQHQFVGVYWARDPEWDFIRASLEGSSYYKLPKVLQWLTGNIGIHHVHHLRPRIPNYHLQQAYDATPEVQAVKPLTLRGSLTCLQLNLYDEERKALVSFHSLKK